MFRQCWAHRGFWDRASWALAGCSAATIVRIPDSRRSWAPPRAESGWTPSWSWSGGSSRLLGPRQPGPAPKKREPLFTRMDVAARDGTGKDGAIWVTYRDGVYDVTDYVREHPGGKLILQGAGGPVDKFWAHWAQHHMSAKVATALHQLRIGRLADYTPEQDEDQYGGGVWEDEQSDPCRIENRRRTSRYCEMPYCAETKASELVKSYLTPAETLYVRNHAPVPSMDSQDATNHEITFQRGGVEITSLSLAELTKRFAKTSVVSVLQCSGNRGADNIAVNGVRNSGFVGGPFEHIGLGLLGNVCWSGVRLSDVLLQLIPNGGQQGSENLCVEDLHVTFEGADGYSTSTPLRYVLDPANTCILATHMNGVPLTPDHGFPVRAILPGITGARQVKWVSRVTVGPECDSAWNAAYYRDGAEGPPLQGLPLNSVMLSPRPGAPICADATHVEVRGVAYSGGSGSPIASVEVSADRGKSWQLASCDLSEAKRHSASTSHAWVRFNADVQLPRSACGQGCGGPLTEMWCRATTISGETQPEISEAHGGYFYNGYHRVPLVMLPAGDTAPEGTSKL